MKHTSPISGIAVYSDEYVATAGYDNQVILWNQHTGHALTRSLHDHLANQCAFSPDGSRLVSSSSDYTARLWSVPDLSLLAVLNDHDDDVEMSVFHPSRPLVATASRDHKVRVYDFDGALVQRFQGHQADVISVEWASTGGELITSSDDGTVKRWSLQTGGLLEDIDLGGVETDTVVIAPDGVLYAGNDLGEIVVITSDGTERVKAHDAGIKRLVLGFDRGLLVSLSYDRTMRIWDIIGSQPTQTVEATFLDDVWPRSCAFAYGPRLVFGTFGSTYRTYDYQLQEWLDETIPTTAGVNGLCIWNEGVLTVGDSGLVLRDDATFARMGSLCNFLTPLTDLVITGGQLGKVMDASTGRVLHQHRSPLNCGATFSRGGAEHVIVGAYTGEGLVFRAEGATLTHVQTLALHENAVKGVAVSGDRIFSVSADQGAAWHDVERLQELHRIDAAHERIANDCVGLGNRWFASVGRDLTLRIWDDDYQCTAVPTPLQHSLKCVSASADGTRVAVGTYDGHVAIYDRARQRWTETYRPTAAGVSALIHDAEAGAFLASSYDGQVYALSGESR